MRSVPCSRGTHSLTVNTRPDDLDDDAIAAALRDGWRFDAIAVEYAAVGFGSHHWIAHDPAGDRR